MKQNTRFTTRIAAIVALGGFLMGFDASVISGVVGAIEREFGLDKIALGWAVASLSLTATLGMMISGPLSDRLGRRPVLVIAALVFLVSAVASALAPTYTALVAARMLGGLGVGTALIVAPMYIAEVAAPAVRGRLVSLNQLNIVLGISAAFFSNYLIQGLGQSTEGWPVALGFDTWGWRWMLGVEAIPALVYLACLPWVPESPRWLVMQGRRDEARSVLERTSDPDRAEADLQAIRASIESGQPRQQARIRELFSPGLRLALIIGLSVGILQQITGINAVFFYAPMIFEQSGIGTDAAFMQAVLVGLTNLVFTVLALMLIDRVGRRPLLLAGTAGIAACMLILAYGFQSAEYRLTTGSLADLPAAVERSALEPLVGQRFEDDLTYRAALRETLGVDALRDHEPALVAAAIDIDATLILFGILGFVASFAVSLGPVMWVLFSEIFPNRVRGLAISFVGLVNSAVSFSVQLIFPWELAHLGNAATFFIFGAFAMVGWVIVARLLPETRGRSLEDLERSLSAT